MGVEEALLGKPLILVAAHPDDETVSAGGLLPRLDRPLLIHITDGAPRNPAYAQAAGFATREDYARARRNELLNAMELAGIPPERMLTIGVIDQESAFQLAGLARRLAAVFRERRPAVVLTHPYEGGHPDHDSAALAVHAACAMVSLAPQLWEFTSYHARAGVLATGEFLIEQERGEAVVLSSEARERKKCMFECFATQNEMLRHFAVDVERFRPAPVYDFSVSPHSGELYYERFDWGVTGARWRALASQALAELNLRTTL
jgi:LmbE family N-acetylglucosaminyl deacetylase